MDPAIFHLVNVVLHGVASFLTYVLLLVLTRRPVISGLGGGFFAVHPIHTEAVSWIVGRAEIMAALFAIASLLLALRAGRATSRGKFALLSMFTLALYAAGLLSKETALTTPLLLLFLWWSRENLRPFQGRGYVLWAGFVATTGAYLLVRVAFLGSLGVSPGGQIFHGTDAWTRLYTMVTVFALYLKLHVLPYPLSIDHAIPFHTTPADWHVIGGLVLAGSYISALIVLFRRDRGLFTGLAWVPVALLPVLNIVPIGSVMAERFAYLASVGVVAAGACGMARLLPVLQASRIPWRRFVLVGVVAVLSGCSALTISRNAEWGNEHVFWSKTVERFPDSAWARGALCEEYRKRGNPTRAIEECREAVRINPKLARGHISLGTAYLAAGRLGEAEDALRKAVSIDARSATAYFNLGLVLEKGGRWDEALGQYAVAFSINPSVVEAYNNAGNLLFLRGDIDAAVGAYQSAIHYRPNLFAARYNLARALMARGDATGAEAQMQAILEAPGGQDWARKVRDLSAGKRVDSGTVRGSH
jgi:Flp pilus assembly protein TadD